MPLISHPGGYGGPNGTVWYLPDAGIPVPSASLVGSVQVIGGNYVQTVLLGEPGPGLTWAVGLPSGPKSTPTWTAEPIEIVLGPLGIERENLLAFLRSADDVSLPIELELDWPEGSGQARPVVIGSIDTIEAIIGDSRVVAVSQAFSGSGISYSARLLSGPLPAGWSINPVTGVLTVGTGVARVDTVEVTASNPGGSVSIQFVVIIRIPVLVNTAAPTLTLLSGAANTVGAAYRLAGAAFAGGLAPRTITARAYRNGAPLSGFVALTGGNFDYTITTADAGSTLSFAARGTDAAGTGMTVFATATVTVPNLAAEAPVVIGSILPVSVTPGAVVTRTAAGVFQSATPISYSMAFSDGALTAGYAINTSTGAITLNTGGTDAGTNRTLVVTATNAGGTAQVSFTFEVAPRMRATTIPQLTATQGSGTNVGDILGIGGGIYAGGVNPTTTTRRFLRGGVAIADFADVQNYTMTAADTAGIVADVRRVDSSDPPQILTLRATGSFAVASTPPVGNPDFTVGTMAELAAAINTACGRTTAQRIMIAPGVIITGQLGSDANRINAIKSGTLNGRARDNERVTITTSRTNPGRIRYSGAGQYSLNFNNLHGFIFDGVWFDCILKDGVTYANAALRSRYGGAAGFPDASAGSIYINYSTSNTFRNCLFEGLHRVCNMQGSAATIWEWCEWRRNGMDCLVTFSSMRDGTGIPQRIQQGLIVRNNLFHQPDIDGVRAPSDAPNRHADYISMQGSNCRDLLYEENVFEGYNGYVQCIFIANGPAVERNEWAKYRHVGVTIRGNVMVGRHQNTLFLNTIENLLCEDNVIRMLDIEGAALGPSAGPARVVWAGGHATPTIFRNNIYPGFAYLHGNSAARFPQAQAGQNGNVLNAAEISFAALPKPRHGRWGYE